MAVILRALGAAAILGVAMPIAAQQPVLADTAKHTPPPTGPVIVTPAADQPRGVDAEIRTALFDLVNNKPLAALSRLEWLAAGHGTALVTSRRSKATGRLCMRVPHRSEKQTQVIHYLGWNK